MAGHWFQQESPTSPSKRAKNCQNYQLDEEEIWELFTNDAWAA